jgi:hypothetical protein
MEMNVYLNRSVGGCKEVQIACPILDIGSRCGPAAFPDVAESQFDRSGRFLLPLTLKGTNFNQ